jgi:hypothetical protein
VGRCGTKCELPSLCPHVNAELLLVHPPIATADDTTGNLGRGCLWADVAQRASLPVTDSPCPHVNAELLLVHPPVATADDATGNLGRGCLWAGAA